MKNQQEVLQKTGSVEIIGMRKYEYLKSLNPESLTGDQKKQIETYEKKRITAGVEQIKRQHDYFERIFKPKQEKEFVVTASKLWVAFNQTFEALNGKPFVKNELTLKNIAPLIYYFSKDERFFRSKNLTNLSTPSFEKGLLIIGTFGNGKTSYMKVFEKLFKGIKGHAFAGYSANEVVTMFEKCANDTDRNNFEKTMWRGILLFDDLKTERIASNYGKVNIFKETLEERYNRRLKTHVTCNFKDRFEGDIEAGIDEFGEKYGGRVYDRIFEMFNIIRFDGKSFRK